MGRAVANAFFLADRVTGPKYPSVFSLSEGVGEGDMTIGVAGMFE